MPETVSFLSFRDFERAMFPAMVRRREREAETPSETGRRCASEALARVAAPTEGDGK